MSKRSKNAGLLLAGLVVVAVIATVIWSGMSSAESSGRSGSNSFAVGAGEESPDDLQSADSVTRSSPQSTRGGSRLDGTGELAAGEDGAAAADEVKKKSRRKKRGRRARKSVEQAEEEEAQKKAAPKRPLPGI